MKHLACRPVSSAAALALTCAAVLLPLSGQAAEGTESAARQRTLQAEAKVLRQAADERFKEQEKACYGKFLVNHCIDLARKERLESIRQARALEAEARQLNLAEREQAAAATLDKQRQVTTLPAEEGAETGPNELDPAPTTPAIPTTPPPASVSAPVAPPASDDSAARAEREARAAEKAAAAQAKQAQRDAERAEKRARSEAQAAERAAAAERDRARYDRRLEQREQEQTGK